MVDEMGKPVLQARAEINKAIGHCKFYEQNSELFLKPESINLGDTPATVNVLYQPIGPLLIIMPWNFPFWLPFKCIIPQFALGNTILLKHAPCVPQCAEAIEDLLIKAGLENVYQNLYLNTEDTEYAISHNNVKGVAFTGSTRAGKVIGGLSGKYLKKCVLELGGSDPFVVLEDADISDAVTKGIMSRTMNSGQACINAKRFILHENVYDEFKEKLIEQVKALKVGDPSTQSTKIGPLARIDLYENLQKQVNSALDQGATLVHGNTDQLENPVNPENGLYFPPTIIEDISEDNIAYKDELFGPVFSLYKVDSEEEAIRLGKLSSKSNFL